MAEKSVRVAVIGRSGKRNYGHDLDMVWLPVPNIEIVAVRKLMAKAGYAEYKEMLAKEKPQVVSVADRWR